jgi:hypothetical protein
MREWPISPNGPPIALQKEGEGLVAGMMVLAGGEVRMYALCVGSVAATKSAKDKGFSRVFMGAKVGRKELCQRWRSFGFLVGGGILSWAIEMRAVWRVELRGGAWDASFGGRRGDARAALYGERCGFSGLAEGMRPCEWGFAL